jgi:glycerol-3-phosphate dehydrogenase
MSIETRHRGSDAAVATATIMGDLLGWDQGTRDREIGHYLARVDAEIDSQNQPDDHTADAARMGAPDVRTGIAE